MLLTNVFGAHVGISQVFSETNILVWRTTQEQHDKYLYAVLQRCE